MRHRSRPSPPHPTVHSFRLASGSDLAALSRYAHQVVAGGLCTTQVVVLELATSIASDRGALGILDVVVGCMTARGVLPVVLVSAPEAFTKSARACWPHLAGVRVVLSRADVALLILDDMWRTH